MLRSHLVPASALMAVRLGARVSFTWWEEGCRVHTLVRGRGAGGGRLLFWQGYLWAEGGIEV